MRFFSRYLNCVTNTNILLKTLNFARVLILIQYIPDMHGIRFLQTNFVIHCPVKPVENDGLCLAKTPDLAVTGSPALFECKLVNRGRTGEFTKETQDTQSRFFIAFFVFALAIHQQYRALYLRSKPLDAKRGPCCKNLGRLGNTHHPPKMVSQPTKFWTYFFGKGEYFIENTRRSIAKYRRH